MMRPLIVLDGSADVENLFLSPACLAAYRRGDTAVYLRKPQVKANWPSAL